VVTFSGDVYSDHQIEDGFIRLFYRETEQTELVWHRDKRDRTVEVLFGDGWKFQYDNHMPKELKVGDILEVKSMEYHRLLKGDTKLILKITEN